MTGAQLLRKVRQVSIIAMAGAIIDANGPAIADLNRQQLLKGLNVEGYQLTPKYSEDPWFKSKESAARYATWKKKLFPDMKYDVPNLIITGVYHRSISVHATTKSVIYQASASFAGGIQSKYKGKVLGLTVQSKGTAWNEIIKSPLLREVSGKTGFKIGKK